MNRSKLYCLLAATCLASASAQAAWKGKGEAGLVFARGNTQTDSINLKFEMSEEVDRWKHLLDMSALRANSTGLATANRYQGGWQSNYQFSDRGFSFGGLRYENDKFSGFNYQANVTGGVGYKFINTEKVKLTGQAGIGYRRLKNALTGTTSGDVIGIAGATYENQLNDSTKIVDKFRLETGSNNTLTANFLGLEVKMNTKLALSLGLDVRNNSKPPSPLKKTDTLTTANIVYAF